MNLPYFTIAVVSYNSSSYIRECLQSILANTFLNFEVVISDDCSSDNTWDIIRSFSDSRIKAYVQESNLGEYANRNFCINKATGKYLLFIDGDDYLYSDGLAYLNRIIKENDECGIILGRPWDEKIIYPFKITSDDFVKSIYMGQHSYEAINFTKAIFLLENLKKEGGLSERYRIGDTYIQLMLGSKYPSLLVNDTFSWWRRREGQASENIITNGEASAESFHFMSAYINSSKCLLKGEELELSKSNLNGTFSRVLINKLFRLKIKSFIKLLKISEFPLNGWRYLFIKSKRNFIISNIE